MYQKIGHRNKWLYINDFTVYQKIGQRTVYQKIGHQKTVYQKIGHQKVGHHYNKQPYKKQF